MPASLRQQGVRGRRLRRNLRLCGEGRTCADGRCECIPNAYKACCGLAVCWFDGCGTVSEKIVDCPNGCEVATCLDCVPLCEGLEYGPDGCGGECGTCKAGTCDETGWTPPESCIGGVCLPSETVSCDDKNPCTDDGCDPEAGCTHANVENGTECGPATCAAGEWRGPAVCNDGECADPVQVTSCEDGQECTTDNCLLDLGCVHSLLPGMCFIQNTCYPAGAKGGPCLVCDPLAPTVWTCAVGTPCNDGIGDTVTTAPSRCAT